ncbi:MAG: 3-phosphoshikimate 1-carboxyvinyltransferase [Ilumatobacter sp.]|uniref:3-phosphoshikimate 1-carboxyvinyltransferase n=2 Tax=Ilumatobacter sp. TaxID=1967498 RepID=UPI001DD93DD1|nr:3-phosphoshikimate 1-carboxyvinyltransferase [Ilumatobacter sp.]MBT5276766.1 3-phosphoshikimate 1-carboxyvinyltransferase [Ilumatobacter sp.]MBT5864869.1 3-phosphoshikimate 1-carboxyvinyltransferase [Ilumatobacter sp.]MDG1390417.1 3-phosphoshikimate 1-carboxyvinyltransferase [Ilumatobacter sp.]
MSESHRVRRADGPVIADVVVPPSKSIANRALICAALADGESEITGVAPGDDTSAMLDCLDRLGIPVAVSKRDGNLVGAVVGSAGNLPAGPITLPTRLAGTTSRFITALAAIGPGPYLVDGDPPLRSRPMGPLHNSLIALGATLEPGDRPGHLPVTVSGPLRGADAVVMPGNVSSQYVSALMLVAPYIRRGLRLGLSTSLVSRPYVEITRAVMTAFGADDIELSDRRVHVGEGGYFGAAYRVEPDASSASYPLAAAAMAGGAVCVRGLGANALQGDARFVDVLVEMGCTATVSADDTVIMRRRDTPLRGIEIDMSDISDLVPTMAVIATQAVTPTRITGVGFIRKKESDRLGDLADELAKTGADITVEADGLLITPTDLLHAATLDTHHDHRLGMAFGILGLVVDGIEVNDPGVVSKSWPAFWDALEAIPARGQ